MNAKGKPRSGGAALARYVMTGKDGELVQVVEARGWQEFAKDPVAAFDRMEQWAAEHTKCRTPFFHGHIRLAPGEELTDAQWMKSLDRAEKRLGFEGQPRIVSFHIDAESGEKHLHAAWCRVDFGDERAIDPGLYKNKLVQLSRTLEREFSIRKLSSARQPGQARAAERDEYEEGKRLGVDTQAVRTTILNCLGQSDGGRSFNAALEEKGLTLANGDRRDCFVVIDQEGGHHALNKKLTGMTLAALRERLSDLDRSQLPGVEQAQELQRERQHQVEADRQAGQAMQAAYAGARGRYDDLRAAEPAPEIGREFQAAAARATEPAAPTWDRDAASRPAEERIIDAAIAATQEARQRPEAQAGRETSPPSWESSQAPPQAAHEPDPAHDLAATADAAIDTAAHAGEGVLRGLGRIFASFIGFLADCIAPPPPPTRDQAERMARSAEEKQEASAEQAARDERHWLVIEAQELARHSADYQPTLAERFGTAKPGAQWEQEQDRGYERERY